MMPLLRRLSSSFGSLNLSSSSSSKLHHYLPTIPSSKAYSSKSSNMNCLFTFRHILDQPLQPIVQQQSLVRPEFLQRDVGLDAKRLLDNTLKYNYYPLSLAGKNYALLNMIKEYEGLHLVIIVSLPLRASNLSKLLQSCEVDSVFVHYEMDVNHRSHLLDSFKTKDHKVLVMTNLEEIVNLGIIHIVVNYDCGVYTVENKPRKLVEQFPEGVVKEVVDFITYPNAKGPPCFEDLLPFGDC